MKRIILLLSCFLIFIGADIEAQSYRYSFKLPALTSGSVMFSNGTTIAQDNANFFWDDTNNRLGIGTSSPTSPFTNAVNSVVSIPASHMSGTWYSGGSATTTKPHLLIEPTGTTSNGWSISGTALGINGASGFSGNLVDIQLNASPRFSISSAGAVILASSINMNAGNFTMSGTSRIAFGSRSRIYSPSDGVLLIQNNAENDLSRIQLGGTTSSFPALKRSSTTIEARLADDSAYAATQSLYDRFGSGTPEGAVTAPVGAVYHRTDGGAGTSFYVKESGTGNTGWVAK